MKSTPLIEMNDPKLVVRGFHLGHKIASNLVNVFTLEELEYFEGNLGQIPAGLERFLNRKSQQSQAKQPENDTSVKSADPSPIIVRPRIEILREAPPLCVNRHVDNQVAGMERMYKMLGWKWNVAGLVIPPRQKGFDRLIVMGDTMLTSNRGYDACAASFRSWRHFDDLDLNVPVNERHPKDGVYAVWFRDRIEADEELAGKSANDIKAIGLKTITLPEREVLELVYHIETGKHLDISGWTLCSGSRGSDGDVPRANWGDDEFGVFCYSPDDRNPDLSSRQAVSL